MGRAEHIGNNGAAAADIGRGGSNPRPKRWLPAAAALLVAIPLHACTSGEGPTVPAPTQAAAKPQRIVSLNLCTDQLLMQMVEPPRIRALTFLAQDPHSSALAEQARLLPTTAGVAEEVIAMEPDLVLAGAFSTRGTVAILRRLGYRVVEFAPEDDFDSIKANIHKLAEAVGEPARGAAMVAAIDAELARIPAPSGERPVFANYSANGFVSGNGTLITAVANVAGFDTLGQRLGIAGWQAIPLEQLLAARPGLIDIGGDYPGPALATELFRHPLLERLMREQHSIDLPGKYTACGSPLTLHAVRALVEARRAL